MNYNSVGEIYDDIEKTRNEIYEKISGLTDEQRNFRADESSWSIVDIIEHLAKTEAGLVPLFFKLLKKAEAESLASDGNFNPPVSLAPYVTKVIDVKLQAPEMIAPSGAATIAESLARLEESRQTILGLRPRFEAVNHTKTVFPHPFIGQMNLYEWLAFIGLHEQRHLSQIKRILSQIENP